MPARVYGYAAVFAFLLQTPETLTKEKLMAMGMGNAFLIVVISMIMGALFGFISGKLAAAMTTKVAAA